MTINNTTKSCHTAYDKVLEEINRCIQKAQKLNEKMQMYLQANAQCDDEQEMLNIFANECQDAITFNILKANELSESLGISYANIASTTIENTSKCVGHIINCNIEKLKATAKMAMTA